MYVSMFRLFLFRGYAFFSVVPVVLFSLNRFFSYRPMASKTKLEKYGYGCVRSNPWFRDQKISKNI